MANERVDEIKAALDEMDRLAVVHIAAQNDPKADVKDVRKVESERDASERAIKYLSIEWLRYLLAENDRLQAVILEAADMTVVPVGERTFGKVSVRVMAIRKVLRDALAALQTGEGA